MMTESSAIKPDPILPLKLYDFVILNEDAKKVIPMNQPNFTEMTKPELRAYVLQHRNDQDAFYALADRISSDPNLRQLKPGERLEDVHPEIIRLRKEHGDWPENS
jgi:hypothetical protein